MNKKFIYLFLLFIFVGAIWFGCKKEKEIEVSLSGVIQKGPFLNGTSVTLYALNSEGTQTGSSYNTQTTDNLGSFQFTNVSLGSNLGLIKADGYYFDEVKNQNSSSPLTLYALSELNSISTININILTHLEKDRILYLMNNGVTYTSAKAQVKSEIYSIFKFNYPSLNNAENLNITGSSEEDAILLATSIIFQGANRTVSELSQLMADFIADFKTDGIINNTSVGSELINDAKSLKLPVIRQNLENKYQGTAIPNFEKYINRFIDSTNFVFTRIIQYPDSGGFYPNLLSHNITIFPKAPLYTNSVGICAILPEHTSLRVVIVNSYALWFGSNMQLEPPNSCGGWQYTFPMGVYDDISTVQTGFVEYYQTLFLTCDSVDTATIYIYENGATTPTRIKHIIGQ